MEQIEKIYLEFSKSFKVSTDSRKIEKDAVYFALKGENFDGNDFALQVVDSDAACVVADRQNLPNHPKIIKVTDSLKALQQLATFHRNKMKAQVLAITGTNGKTTTKELVSAVLSKKYQIIHTQGNFNNHIGVPLTLLQIRPETEIAVVEMGANHQGEISTLCNIAQPDFGIITNIGKAHLEGFGGFTGVINAKSELYNYLHDHQKKAFVNVANPLLCQLSKNLDKYTYGNNFEADIYGETLAADPYLSVLFEEKENKSTVHTNLIGLYNFENVMAAIAVGIFFGLGKDEILEAVSSYHPTNNRSQLIETKSNRLIMDAYNANPISMAAAIKNFREICGSKELLILGDMLELGNETDQEHAEILKLLIDLDFENVFLIGENFKRVHGESNWKNFLKVDDLCQYLQENQLSGYDILIKGSRGIKLEKVLPFL